MIKDVHYQQKKGPQDVTVHEMLIQAQIDDVHGKLRMDKAKIRAIVEWEPRIKWILVESSPVDRPTQEEQAVGMIRGVSTCFRGLEGGEELSPKQARWQDFLAEFDYVLEYKPKKANVVADALSRKAELAAISLAKGNVHEMIKEGLEHNPMAKEDCTEEEAAKAFFKNVVKYWGLPKSIISDRDPRVTGRLWTELFKLLGSDANQHDWAKLFDVAQFSYNLQRSEATGKSPFELAIGQQPLTPHTLAISFDSVKCPGAAKMAKSWEEQSDLAKSFMEKARRKMKKRADPKRRYLEFNVDDKVLIKLIPQQFKAFRGMHKGLVRKYEGPYPVVAKVGKVSYRLDLPSTLKIHPVFHVSMLRLYQGDEEDPSRGESHQAPPVVTKSFDKEIEEVLSHKVVRRRGVKTMTHYFIKWKGLPESEATWESQDDL
ncbi:hypothetical protein BUALT_Bualt09G0113300 [Buddleja alternifolia]|uniref:Chromo domain-containing protein n=1 Tax=Buddleja alternifolia TaxID=168488 RepID=A0AAV6X618_9LAMI|nr:hypothetical protein BUALT_Bualt09G0113300 [Buddleja alternifolia]